MDAPAVLTCVAPPSLAPAETFSPDGPDTLVVHAPALGIDDVLADVTAATEAVCVGDTATEAIRVGDDSEHSPRPNGGPSVTASVVIADLYAWCGGTDGVAGRRGRLRDRLDGPGVVTAFVEPSRLDWLCRADAVPVSAFDRIVHLRYDADDTAPGGEVDAAVAAARRLADGVDASDGVVRATLSIHRYGHAYEYAPPPLAGETYGPSLTPGILARLPRGEWADGGERPLARLRDAAARLAGALTRRAEALTVSRSSPTGVELRPDPVWTERYERHRERLRRRTDPRAVFHVGSTAVPDLAGRPQLDVIAVYDDEAGVDAAATALAAAGERWQRTDSEDGDAVVSWRDPPEAVYLKLHPVGDEKALSQIAFRDHLRADEAARRRYERVVREAAEAHDEFRPYQEAKADVVAELTEAARAAGRYEALPDRIR